MTEEFLHKLRVVPTNNIEKVGEKFVLEGLLLARQKTIDIMHEIRRALTPGLTEDDARKLALDIFRAHGVEKHWHKPYIRFGAGTALSFHEPLQEKYQLKLNDPFYIDLGPVWPDAEHELLYEGDVGDTFILGTNEAAEQCAKTTRLIFSEAQAHWRKLMCTGKELYSFIKQRAGYYGYDLKENVDGHRLSDFPHHYYSRKRLAELDLIPTPSLWVLEIQLVDKSKKFGAFYEDLLMSESD